MLILQSNILIEIQYYICVHMIIYLYKECCCKYNSFEFYSQHRWQITQVDCKSNLILGSKSRNQRKYSEE